ncbi:MAG: hypothetical protein QM811_07050 [Pirellulales bacterium]
MRAMLAVVFAVVCAVGLGQEPAKEKPDRFANVKAFDEYAKTLLLGVGDLTEVQRQKYFDDNEKAIVKEIDGKTWVLPITIQEVRNSDFDTPGTYAVDYTIGELPKLECRISTSDTIELKMTRDQAAKLVRGAAYELTGKAAKISATQSQAKNNQIRAALERRNCASIRMGTKEASLSFNVIDIKLGVPKD